MTITYDKDAPKMTPAVENYVKDVLLASVLDESDASGNITDEYIFFGGKRIARRNVSSGNIFYYFADHLGTSRVILQAGQTTPCYDADFYPFGGERVVTNTCPQNYKFTGKERDSESGLDDFEARYYSSALGRFMSPDEFPGGPVDLFGEADPPGPLPYADIANPQSLNKYPYAYNNPLRYVDPNGHDIVSFLTGLANSLYSNATLGAAPRIEAGPSGLKEGQVVGDVISTLVGAIETALGAGIEVGGLALDTTGIGAVIGVLPNVVGAVVITHGGTMTATSAIHLAQDASDAYKATPENVDRMEKGKPPIGNGAHPSSSTMRVATQRVQQRK